MPGHLAALAVSRKDGVGAAAFSNSSSRFEPGPFACALVNAWLENDPPAPSPWVAGPPVPADVEPLLGRWWTEGAEWVLSWRGGRLEAAPAGAPATFVPWAFERDGDSFRTVSGLEAGEALRVVRDAEGNVVKLYWATYPLTRHPATFGSTA
jgi:hypothetical protein